MKHSFFRVRSDELNDNLYIGLTKSDLSPLNGVALSDKRQTLFIFKYRKVIS